MPHKMEKVMSEYKAGDTSLNQEEIKQLKRKQAIAIGLSYGAKRHTEKNQNKLKNNEKKYFLRRSNGGL